MNNWKVGDKVMLSPECPYFGEGHENPVNCIGTVLFIDDDELEGWPINVEWENGESNCYKTEHLIPAKTDPSIDMVLLDVAKHVAAGLAARQGWEVDCITTTAIEIADQLIKECIK